MIKLITPHLTFKLLYDVSTNLASAWLGVVLISPGFIGVASLEDYLTLLWRHLPFGIVSIVISYWFLTKSQKTP